MADRKAEAAGAALMGVAGAASIYSMGPTNTKTNRIQDRRNKQNKKLNQSRVKANEAKMSFAKEDLRRLQGIKNSDLDKSNVKIKNELIKKTKRHY
jgi:guanylate kinase